MKLSTRLADENYAFNRSDHLAVSLCDVYLSKISLSKTCLKPHEFRNWNPKFSCLVLVIGQ
jgi:hypothetical protein